MSDQEQKVVEGLFDKIDWEALLAKIPWETIITALVNKLIEYLNNQPSVTAPVGKIDWKALLARIPWEKLALLLLGLLFKEPEPAPTPSV